LPARRLGRDFFRQPTLEVARALLGHRLVRVAGGRRTAGLIVETEAYLGEEDLACHASAGRTARTAVMYGPPGHAYIYLIYGMYHCLNIVTEERDSPAAVLIRALEPVEGIALMAERRGLGARLEAEGRPAERPGPGLRALASGPGRLCQALAINRELDGESLLGRRLFLERGNPPPAIAATPRIGVGYAGAWRLKPWRFVVASSPWVSNGRPRTARRPGGPRPSG
jgi:DNA-3-methyladenine glycosylase